MDLIKSGLDELGVKYGDREIELLQEYIDEVMFFNPKYGLVNAEGDTFIIKHILDSLAGVPEIIKRDPKSVADVGSGGGFPGIPLAIFFEDVSFTLIERSGKRCNFLRNAIVTLGIKNVEIVEAPVESVQKRFDLVTFRAFTPMEKPITKCLLSILNEKGIIFAYKGRRETIEDEISNINELISYNEIIPVKVPYLEDERNFLVLS